MVITHEELHAQAEGLQEYLYNASSDGRGPELIVCDDQQQAIRLHNELRVLIHLGDTPLIAAHRHDRRVSIWLTENGLAHMRRLHPRPSPVLDQEPLYWRPEQRA